jgi:hypothetical protein
MQVKDKESLRSSGIGKAVHVAAKCLKDAPEVQEVA